MANGKAVKRLAAMAGNSVHPAFGVVGEALSAVEEMELGSSVPGWVSIGALAAAYYFLFRRK